MESCGDHNSHLELSLKVSLKALIDGRRCKSVKIRYFTLCIHCLGLFPVVAAVFDADVSPFFRVVCGVAPLSEMGALSS